MIIRHVVQIDNRRDFKAESKLFLCRKYAFLDIVNQFLPGIIPFGVVKDRLFSYADEQTPPLYIWNQLLVILAIGFCNIFKIHLRCRNETLDSLRIIGIIWNPAGFSDI